MCSEDASRWDRRYQSEGDEWLARPPRALLVDHVDLLPKRGFALDAAAGVGANGLFLARRGFHVIVADVSEVALRLAIGRSRAAGLNMEGVVLDLSSPWFPKECFDLILNFYFLERGALPVYGMSLKPGGLLFFETLVRHGSKGERPAHYLESGELTAAFAGWDILHLGRTEHVRHSSRRCKITEQLIARRPA